MKKLLLWGIFPIIFIFTLAFSINATSTRFNLSTYVYDMYSNFNVIGELGMQCGYAEGYVESNPETGNPLDGVDSLTCGNFMNICNWNFNSIGRCYVPYTYPVILHLELLANITFTGNVFNLSVGDCSSHAIQKYLVENRINHQNPPYTIIGNQTNASGDCFNGYQTLVTEGTFKTEFLLFTFYNVSNFSSGVLVKEIYINAWYDDCDMEHLDNCTHIGPICLNSNLLCTNGITINSTTTCETQNLVACGCNLTSNSCVDGSICTPSYMKCCSDYNCINYDAGGNLYKCSDSGNNWTLQQQCISTACYENTPLYAYCGDALIYYCYMALQNKCIYSSVNATGICFNTLPGCNAQIGVAPPTNATNPIAGFDLANKIENWWCTVGVCSIASRVIIALLIMLISAAIIVFMTIQHGAPVTFGAVMIIEIIEMILFVYIKLLPIWIPIVFTICGVGIFALTITTKMQSGSG